MKRYAWDSPEMKAAIAGLPAFAAEVATALGPWTATDPAPDRDPREPAPHWWHLTREDGATLSLHFDQHENRYQWTGLYPNEDHPEARHMIGRPPYGCGDALTINVGYGRPPAAHAGEIARRLLPTYLVQWTKALERLERVTAHREAARRLAEDLARIAGPAARLRRPESPSADHVIDLREPWSATLRVSGSYIRFDHMSVEPQHARLLLAAPKLLASVTEAAAEGCRETESHDCGKCPPCAARLLLADLSL